MPEGMREPACVHCSVDEYTLNTSGALRKVKDRSVYECVLIHEVIKVILMRERCVFFFRYSHFSMQMEQPLHQ